MFNMVLLEAAAGGGAMMSWIWIILLIGVFYFFMIRPQQQQQKKLREERSKMAKGDNIVTSGGLYGKIDGIITRTNKKGEQEVTDFIVSLKPDGTKVQISKECVFKDVNDIAQK